MPSRVATTEDGEPLILSPLRGCGSSLVYGTTTLAAVPLGQLPIERSARGTGCTRRSPNRPQLQKPTEAGSPPCSPQIPILSLVFVLRPFLNAHFNQLADTFLIERLERVNRDDLVLDVIGQETADVVAAVAERHLGQVVGAEAEEVGVLGDFISRQASTWDLDHGADQDVQLAFELLRCNRLGSMVSSTFARRMRSSAAVPTSGIMISG